MGTLAEIGPLRVGRAIWGAIVADLGGLRHFSWVFTAYMLASTVSLPIYGKLSDVYGRRRLWVGGLALFMLGSALAGLSQGMPHLILAPGAAGTRRGRPDGAGRGHHRRSLPARRAR